MTAGAAAQASINLSALRHNLRIARHKAPQSRIMAVVKADAYGHGLARTVGALAGADGFVVARMDEALAVRHCGVSRPVLLLAGVMTESELQLAAQHRLDVVVHQPGQAALLERGFARVRAWLKVDSGMHRLGFSPERIGDLHGRLSSCADPEHPVGLMTHLANADDRNNPSTLRQLEIFGRATGGLPAERSLANSAGLLGWPQSHADWVRPGIMLYGVSPFIGRGGEQEGLQPVMTLSSRLIAVNPLRRGDRIGYGGAWRCPEDMPVGVAAIGYGDGYPHHARSGTPVLVNGRRACLVGRVSMDMICIDLRGQPDAQPGDPVVLWGEGLAVEEIARHASTIAYELLCGVASRVKFSEHGGKNN